MKDSRHDIMMAYYYQKLADILEEKIFKVRWLNSGKNKMSVMERKLRLRKIDIEDEIEFHQMEFAKNFNGEDFSEEPTDKEVYDYIYLIQSRTVKSSIES